ncbi:MAG: transporter [bacterium]|nr:transporter [bacterium]
MRDHRPEEERRRPRATAALPLLALLLLLPATATSSGATSLVGEMARAFDRRIFPTPGGRFTQLVTPVVQRLALAGIDLPPIATSPSFYWSYDADGVPTRSRGALGSMFAERASTLGARRWDVGLAVRHADLEKFDGAPLANQLTVTSRVPFGDGVVRQRFAAADFRLRLDMLDVAVTYGVTDRWDVNLLVPVVVSDLTLAGEATAQVAGSFAGPPVHEAVGVDGTRAGVGDLLLRTKYRFLDHGAGRLAALATLRLPSGDPDDFHGTGDTRLGAALIASRDFRGNDLHLNLGWVLDATDLQRSRATYALGVAIRAAEPVTLLLDLLGASTVVDDEFTVADGRFPQQYGFDELVRGRANGVVYAAIPRADVVNLAVGTKIALGPWFVTAVSAVVPLTRDSLRPDVMVAWSLEAAF